NAELFRRQCGRRAAAGKPIMQSCTENNASLRAAGTRHGNVWPPKTQTVLGCRAILTTEHRYGGVAMPINENLEPSDEEVRTVHDFIQFIADVSVEVRAFDYTDEQWAGIERSLLHLKPDQAALERARNELVGAARINLVELLDDALGRRNIEKCTTKEWAR